MICLRRALQRTGSCRLDGPLVQSLNLNILFFGRILVVNVHRDRIMVWQDDQAVGFLVAFDCKKWYDRSVVSLKHNGNQPKWLPHLEQLLHHGSLQRE